MATTAKKTQAPTKPATPAKADETPAGGKPSTVPPAAGGTDPDPAPDGAGSADTPPNPDEAPPAEAGEGDAEAARAAALAKLAAGGAPATSEAGGGKAAPLALPTLTGVEYEWGGTRRMVVTMSRFSAMVKNGRHTTHQTARAGDVVHVADDVADRGVKLGALAPAPE